MAGAGWTPGSIGGGLVAGLAITGLMLKGERDGGQASELAMLSRNSASRFGIPSPKGTQPPEVVEQVVIQGGHLVLSALAGAFYARTFTKSAPVVPTGILFGLSFYVLAHVIAGPLLGAKAPEWRQPSGTPLRHAITHMLFGITTALGGRLGASLG